MLNRTRLLLGAMLILFGLLALGLWREKKAGALLRRGASVTTRAWAEIADMASDTKGYGEPRQVGAITDKALKEISGIAPGRVTPGVWWVHNDSGGAARLYAINSEGKLLGSFNVSGAKNKDWEDIAGGPGRGGAPALYIADIGDNGASRDDLVVYRVKEPRLTPGAKSQSTEPAEAFPFRYPDGRHNAEAIFVDPESGRPYIVTKTQTSRCGVYRFPLPLRPGQSVMLEEVKGESIASIAQLRLVTGAAASPDGRRVGVRTYFSAVELRRAPGRGFEAVFSAELVPIRLPLEQQGEAIAYTADGKAIVTTSEKLPAPIYQMTRQGP